MAGEIVDLLGNPITIGSRIAYAVRVVDIASMNVGVVKDIVNFVKARPGGKVKLKVRVEESSRYGGVPMGIVTLEHLDRVIVINPGSKTHETH